MQLVVSIAIVSVSPISQMKLNALYPVKNTQSDLCDCRKSMYSTFGIFAQQSYDFFCEVIEMAAKRSCWWYGVHLDANDPDSLAQLLYVILATSNLSLCWMLVVLYCQVNLIEMRLQTLHKAYSLAM
jgi:hypothetical protein